LKFFSAGLSYLLHPKDFILAVAFQLLAVFGYCSLVHGVVMLELIKLIDA
jgi:hypothetical protein